MSIKIMLKKAEKTGFRVLEREQKHFLVSEFEESQCIELSELYNEIMNEIRDGELEVPSAKKYHDLLVLQGDYMSDRIITRDRRIAEYKDYRDALKFVCEEILLANELDWRIDFEVFNLGVGRPPLARVVLYKH